VHQPVKDFFVTAERFGKSNQYFGVVIEHLVNQYNKDKQEM
jgi:hypothetical protein